MIQNLIPDIYELIKRKDGWFTTEIGDTLAKNVVSRLHGQLGQSEGRRGLRLSQLGPRCPRALWYSVNAPECAEPLPPWAEIKYSYGHILEALVLALAKAAGHDVQGEQDELVLDGIVGHRDCIIDGCLCDVKSSSSRGMEKFKKREGLLEDDPFGYLDQLDGYVCASLEDDLVKVKDKGYIIAIDKQLGHMVLYEHTIRPIHIRNRIRDFKGIVSLLQPPACTCGVVASGAAGNLQLDVKASYSPYKYQCFPGLRTFLYASGPVYLTKVVRVPDVPEVDQYGKRVY